MGSIRYERHALGATPVQLRNAYWTFRFFHLYAKLERVAAVLAPGVQDAGLGAPGRDWSWDAHPACGRMG